MFPSLLVTIIFAESRDLEPHRTIIYYLYIFGTANHVKDVTWDSNNIYICNSAIMTRCDVHCSKRPNDDRHRPPI